MNTIYLDHAAATPLDSRVNAAMQPYMSDTYYNPSASYAAAVQVRRDIDEARAAVALILGCRPAEIVFTAGATEANNMAVKGIMEMVLQSHPEARLLMSAVEHDSVLAAGVPYAHSLIPVDTAGVIDIAALQPMLTDETALVSIMYANNEIGTVQPLAKIGQLIEQVRKDRRRRGVSMPLVYHTDAAQAGNYLDVHVSRLGVDLLSLNGGKIYGPKQSGVLYVKGGIRVQALIAGGGQERGLRSGTENVAGIIGLSAALKITQDMRSAESQRLSGLQQQFVSWLQRQVPSAVINGSTKHRLPNNLHITVPGHDNERLLYQLDAVGVMASAGSACSASHEESSHVLAAIGLSETEARASLRFTMGRSTTAQDVTAAVEHLSRLLG